jgi:hypothetical protein
LPEGLFSNQKSQLGYILEGLPMEGVGKSYGHLVYFVVIWYILWSFGIFCAHVVYISRFGKLQQEKSGNPVRRAFLLQPSLRPAPSRPRPSCARSATSLRWSSSTFPAANSSRDRFYKTPVPAAKVSD